MASKKKDLEIVYNLQWKNKPIIGDEKSNMVGMYDIPATTLNWDTFKSYLLKNSGTTGDDVKVSYVNSEDKEVTIESQLDFQIALYLFRQRARIGEIITLKLDRIVDKKPKSTLLNLRKLKSSTDVQVQVENKPLSRSSSFSDTPPDWFMKYMKKFKEEIIEEISATMSTTKSSCVSQVGSHHSRKYKVESYKRSRKTPLMLGDINNDKETLKSSKLERKLENKLEKLEHKTMKVKAKKMALRGSSDSDVGRGSSKSRPIGLPPWDSELLMNASAINQYETTIPHMSGGETYLQKWEIINSGKLPWTGDTELRYAWGSQAFTPVDKRVPCPYLNPGEQGTVAVLLDIPTTSGSYECYWHFHHNGRRFGHWLGCQVIVDESPVKDEHYLPPTKYDIINIKDMYELVLPTSWTSSPKKIKVDEFKPPKLVESIGDNDEIQYNEEDAGGRGFVTCVSVELPKRSPTQTLENKEEPNAENHLHKHEYKNVMENIDTSLQNLKIVSDSDNQSIISISDSNTSVNSASSEEFVLVPISNIDETNDQIESNIFQKLSSTQSSEKFTIEVISPELNEVLVNIVPISPNKENIVKGDKHLDVTMEISTCDKLESDSNNNNTEEVSINSGLSTSSARLEELPIDLSNKCDGIANKIENTERNQSGYAYVYYKGQRIPIAKEYLRADYLETAEEVTVLKENYPIEICEDHSKTVKNDKESNNVVDFNQKMTQSEYVSIDSTFNDSHCSAAASTFSDKTNSQTNAKRFFVFPQNYPGYEVINLPGNSTPQSYIPEQMSSQYFNSSVHSCDNTYHRYSSNPQFNNGIEMQRQVLMNDWTTGQNFPHSYAPYYSNYHPFMENGCTYEPAISNCTVGANTYANIQEEFAPAAIPNVINPHVFEGLRPLEPSCPYKINEHTLAGCNSSSCKLEHTPDHKESHFEARSFTVNSTKSCSSQSTASQTCQNSSRSKCNSSAQSVPDNLLTGAAIVATSAMNTARSVLNMFLGPRTADNGRWENGHWISTNPESRREKSLRILHEMGFYNRDLNATLLARYNDDLTKVIFELVQ